MPWMLYSILSVKFQFSVSTAILQKRVQQSLRKKSKDLGIWRLKCAERITVAERKQSFDDYWQLGQRDRRAAFKSVTTLPKKSQTTGCREKNRDCQCVYKVLISNEEEPICKECFCRLLGKTKGFVNVMVEKKKLRAS